jgi:hypothetical protein
MLYSLNCQPKMSINLIFILMLSCVQFFTVGFFLQITPSTGWQVSPTTIFGVLISVLATAVVVLWKSNKDKDQKIEELNKFIINKVELLSKHKD